MSSKLMPQLEIRDFRLVDAVARHGTLTAARAELHVTQSALSHQLADLEGRLGAAVFDRVGRRMELTSLGSRIRQEGEQVLKALRRAEESVRLALEQKSAVLRLATECYTCYHWLPPLLTEYSKRFPEVETRIVADATKDPLPALLDGELDVGIVSCQQPGRQFEQTAVLTDEIVAVIAPDHPWANCPFVRPEDFEDVHLINYVDPEESTLYQAFLEPAGVEPARLSVVTLTEAIIEMVRAGLGVGVLAQWAVAPHLEAGSVAVARLGRAGLGRTWSAVTRKRRRQPEHIAQFVDLLKEFDLKGFTRYTTARAHQGVA